MANRKHHRVAILGTTHHLGLVAILFVLYLMYVPTAKKSFDENDVTLPWITLNVIRISNWFREYWWSVLPVVVSLSITQFMILLKVDNRSNRVRLKLAWVVCIEMLLALIGFATLTAIELARP